jgi:hypothetical protein
MAPEVPRAIVVQQDGSVALHEIAEAKAGPADIQSSLLRSAESL